MKVIEARALGRRVAALVHTGQFDAATVRLSPVLAERTPFRLLRPIGEAIGAGSLATANPFLDRIAADKTEGGWVIIASALEAQLDRDLEGAFTRCRGFIIAADVWYAADTLGEGVPGRALGAYFQSALDELAPWRGDASHWVRRAVGTGVHFWAKRSRGAAEHVSQAMALLTFLEPMFDEWDMTAVKGVGWGLKTLGRFYPDLVADWLAQQVLRRERRHRALMLRKALTYLSDEQRARATGKVPQHP